MATCFINDNFLSQLKLAYVKTPIMGVNSVGSRASNRRTTRFP